MFAEIMLLLYVAHLTADYPGQPDWQAKRKAGWEDAAGQHHHGWGANLAHAGTHVLLCAIALAVGNAVLDLGLQPAPTALALAWIGGTHAVIDRRWPVAWWMRNTGQREFLDRGGAAHVDQTAHVTAIAIAALGLAA